MKTKSRLYLSVAAVAVAAFLNIPSAQLHAQQAANPAIHVGANDLGGVVTGPTGPEAGVWVIAETTELGTKMAKMVVTDDQGRYVLPDLPKANYNVWVRGYGLVDSPKVQSCARQDAQSHRREGARREGGGAILSGDLLVRDDEDSGQEPVPRHRTERQRHQPADEGPGRIPRHGQDRRLRHLPSARQQGDPRDRAGARRTFKTGFEAWTRRVQSGQAATNMINNLDRMGTTGSLKMFSDWTDRIAAGELPASKPQRPQGVERNVVVTVWDWSSPTAYLHDSISTDRRNPTVNANGPLFGSTEN